MAGMASRLSSPAEDKVKAETGLSRQIAPSGGQTGFRGVLISASILLIAVLGLGGYLLHLKRVAAEHRQKPLAAVAIPPSSAAPGQDATLVFAEDSAGKFVTSKVSISTSSDPGERMRAELRALIAASLQTDSPHLFAADADVIAVFLLGNDTVVINSNAAFAGRPGGISPGPLTIESILRTLAANHPAVQRVKFLVDGEEPQQLAGRIDLHGYFLVGSSSSSR